MHNADDQLLTKYQLNNTKTYLFLTMYVLLRKLETNYLRRKSLFSPIAFKIGELANKKTQGGYIGVILQIFMIMIHTGCKLEKSM